MIVRIHKVVDREGVLTFKQTRAATNNLLKLNHRIDRAEQDDVTDLGRVDTSAELLRSR